MGPPRFDPRGLARIYDSPAVRAQRTVTRRLLDARPGETLLDLGCGPGHLTSELAAETSGDGRFIALDRQPGMVQAAASRAVAAGVAQRCLFVLGEATAVPLAPGTCDGVVAVQVLEYVPDIARALAEIHRVLRPGGRAVILDTDWRSCIWHSADDTRTDTVLRAWDEHCVHPHLPAHLLPMARAAGFTCAEVHAVPLVETDTRADTYSMGMLATIAHFVGRRQPELVEAWRADIRSGAAEGDYFFSLTRFATVIRC
ncbi:methyltransferase domain-containing protein [Geodermatophilus sp. DF01-2]|uniref:methyltransferase domain-containing protein n=1 Tax=Geodermatophilus sp. DF01-2 TaxID=2559610 RepID=UPI0010746AC7|nr:methyltransferase domain-containing protein [Geodermatophilus sp. DF01_2]TFV61913.1 methyltransferase domain-containing protein [Geodermatophilus sp. DF01_2]